jgi:hypothetical protein
MDPLKLGTPDGMLEGIESHADDEQPAYKITNIDPNPPNYSIPIRLELAQAILLEESLSVFIAKYRKPPFSEVGHA